ncbi:hypothetical protein AMIS_12560 [Actinoplanes missouriensis 431]|uniref:Uncharacterized protein n=1 Tax=Actinoplanes missouriensis (strain ATCC 14538 / DSM 43046 / CBS 188.64 / JCM 3121 / NBRC 102363 / NCIMB 12654 / NRRL B-3342 / UNCC 431) TaxID=512565 RepID=I0H0D9_ACTM4|nr:hypothetical protein [Actinoplanes missouriensis]BAL86476.1 hypothetical protein AMIS_12560 [Actinoplanes missouriensis 431]
MMATFDQWLDAYSDAYDMIPGPIDAACPNCGQQCLRLVFTSVPGRDVGYAHFWCDNCLQGIGVSRTLVPEHALVQDGRLPRDEREPKIPNFRIAS